jgi:hypothetical protein
MSVDWPTVKDALIEFAKSTNVIGDDRQIYWAEESKPNANGDYLLLDIYNERAYGSDDVEDVGVDDGLGNITWCNRITGVREFTCSFLFRSRSAKGLRAARQALETIRSSLDHPVRRRVLDDVNVGYLGTDPIVSQNVEHDQRKESIATLAVRFSAFSELFVDEFDPQTEAMETVLQLDGVDVVTIAVP